MKKTIEKPIDLHLALCYDVLDINQEYGNYDASCVPSYVRKEIEASDNQVQTAINFFYGVHEKLFSLYYGKENKWV